MHAIKKGAEWITNKFLKARDLFNSSETKTFVKDLRKVMTYHYGHSGRKCQYPKNYDKIVEGEFEKVNKGGSYELIEGKFEKVDKDGSYELIKGKIKSEVKEGEKEKSYKLVYKGEVFPLAIVRTIDNHSYATIDFLVNPKQRELRNDSRSNFKKYYKPFGFSRIDLEDHVPVFEFDNKSLELTNSSVLVKEGCSLNEKGQADEKDRDKKGRNGELLYTCDYKELSNGFFEIRDKNNNLELDKSLLSVPIVLAAGFAKLCAKWVTYLPMKLGEWLISKQNPAAKAVGYLLFTPAAAVKNLVNIGSTILKAPILLFVANKEKYGDSYLTMWKNQLKEYWKEVKNDFSVIKNGEREEQKNYPPFEGAGTWKELDAMKPTIEKDLKQRASQKDQSVSPGKTSEIVKPRNTVIAEETMSATPPSSTPPVNTKQNVSNGTLSCDNLNDESYADKIRRQNSQSSINTTQRH